MNEWICPEAASLPGIAPSFPALPVVIFELYNFYYTCMPDTDNQPVKAAITTNQPTDGNLL